MQEINQIQEHVANNRLDAAIDQLIELSKSNNSYFFNDLIMLKSRYNQLQQRNRMGIITAREANVESNQITYALLELLKDFSKDFSYRTLQSTTSNSEATSSIQSVARERTTKILFLQANPVDSARLFLDKEMRDIESKLRMSQNRDKFAIVKKGALRANDLNESLLNENPHIVHFSGHGTEDGIVVMDANDKSTTISNEALAGLFKLFQSNIACVFLNSCYSEVQALLINKYIPHVIGMRKPAKDKTAILFSTAFYTALGAGRGFDFAFEFAKNSLDLNNIPGNDIPVYLYQMNADEL